MQIKNGNESFLKNEKYITISHFIIAQLKGTEFRTKVSQVITMECHTKTFEKTLTYR